jgi:hypothetical protein
VSIPVASAGTALADEPPAPETAPDPPAAASRAFDPNAQAPVAAAPPSAATLPPAARSQPLPQPPPAPFPPAPQTSETISAPPTASGIALELGTGGLSGGSVGLGWGWARSALGLSVDYRRSNGSMSEASGFLATETIENRLSVGPWARFELAHALDGRVGLLAAIDIQYTWVSNEISTSGGFNEPPNTISLSGIDLRAGPGIRWWATPWLAVGYTAQLSFSRISGTMSSPSTPVVGGASTSLTDTAVALVGRFLVMAVF